MPIAKSDRLSDLYFILLCNALAGYALVGKGFAYLGWPPIFVGELTYAVGFGIVLRSGCAFVALTTSPCIVLACAMVWVASRTLPYIGAYGADALRDSVVIMYGGFAFVVVGLIVDNARRTDVTLRYYGDFVKIFILTIPFIFGAVKYLGAFIPSYPGSGVPILEVRPGEVAVHLAGAAVFALTGLVKIAWWRWLFFGVALLMAVVESRGAMLAFCVPVAVAALVDGQVKKLAGGVAVVGMCFGLAYILESGSGDYREANSTDDRSLSAHQLGENLGSLIGNAGEQTQSTKEWRIEWWNIIIADTVYGDNFWVGRGFGINLADADGFQDGDHPNLPPLRSPHNVQMTILARAGVPGLALWLGFLLSWFGMMASALVRAKRRGDFVWAKAFLFVVCYCMGFVINATFDVALEGPMQGIWFWCLIGFGISLVMTYRFQCERESLMRQRMSLAPHE